MAFDVEFTPEFEEFWDRLTVEEQYSVAHGVRLLQRFGPALSRPHADTLKGSRFPNMKELRVQHAGRPFRVLFAFDPRRVALLLFGGDKTGKKHWTSDAIAKADDLFERHLTRLRASRREEYG